MSEREPECFARWRAVDGRDRTEVRAALLDPCGGDEFTIAAWCLEYLATTPQPPEPEPVCAASEVVEAVRAYREACRRLDPIRTDAATAVLVALRTATIRTEAEVRAEALREAAETLAAEVRPLHYNSGCNEYYSGYVAGLIRAEEALRALAKGDGE